MKKFRSIILLLILLILSFFVYFIGEFKISGTLLFLFFLIGVIVAFAKWQFEKRINFEVSGLINQEPLQKEKTISQEMLFDLPVPVQRWLIESGVVGRESVGIVQLKQVGSMRNKPGQKYWSKFQAEQYISITHPSFIWKIRMDLLPFIFIIGRDKFINGKGQMTIKILSLFNMVNSTGVKINQGSLQRWLAEICWCPSAALNENISWEAIDSLSASATLSYCGVTGQVIFHFNERGDVVKCTADRYFGGETNSTIEKWVIESKEFAISNGIKIPVKSNVIWKLSGGDFHWLSLEIIDINYNQVV
jgi:hypothetical protein